MYAPPTPPGTASLWLVVWFLWARGCFFRPLRKLPLPALKSKSTSSSFAEPLGQHERLKTNPRNRCRVSVSPPKGWALEGSVWKEERVNSEQPWACGWRSGLSGSSTQQSGERTEPRTFLKMTDASSGLGPKLLILEKHILQIAGKNSQPGVSCQNYFFLFPPTPLEKKYEVKIF